MPRPTAPAEDDTSPRRTGGSAWPGLWRPSVCARNLAAALERTGLVVEVHLLPALRPTGS